MQVGSGIGANREEISAGERATKVRKTCGGVMQLELIQHRHSHDQVRCDSVNTYAHES